MHLTTCYSPIRVKRYGEERLVPCGKCDACKHIRASVMSQRFDLEIQHHKYGLFFTLTYAQPFLHFVKYDSHNRLFYRPDTHDVNCSCFSFDDFDCGECWSFPYMSDDALRLYNSFERQLGGLPVLYKPDIQRFMKRLRITIKRKLHENKEIYYGICGEYGPNTYRPHYHGILLFDDEELLKTLPKLLRQTWTFGSVVSRFIDCKSEKSTYITRYINSFAGLPSLYRTKEFRPFFLISKSHPCGFGKIDETEIQKLFQSKSPTYRTWDVKALQYIDLPIPRTIENWLFPKFSGYCRISDKLRVELVGIAAQYEKLKYFLNDVYENVENSYIHLCSRFENEKYWSFDSSITEYLYLMHKDISLALSLGKYRKSANCCLSSLFYAAKRIIRNMHRFSIDSISDYIRESNVYDFNKSMYLLKKQCEFEEALMKSEPEKIKYIDLLEFNDDVFNSFDFKKMKQYIDGQIEHSKMNRKRNEYFRYNPAYSLNNETKFGHF